MPDIDPQLRNRLSSWRRVAGSSPSQKETQPVDPEFPRFDRGAIGVESPAVLHFRSQHSQLKTLLLLVIAELDKTYELVSAYQAQTERSLEHTRYLEEKTAYCLGVYEQAVSHALSRAQTNVLLDLPYEREVVRRVYVREPREESLLQRLFGL